jgi:hypothetical protein
MRFGADEGIGGIKNNDGERNVQTYKSIRIQNQQRGYNLMYSVWCNQSSHELYDMTVSSQFPYLNGDTT